MSRDLGPSACGNTHTHMMTYEYVGGWGLARLPYVGVDRRVVVEHMRRRVQGRVGETVGVAPQQQDHWEFFQFQGGRAAGEMDRAAA